MIKSPSIGILLIDGPFVLRWKRYKRYIKVGKDILPDNLSGIKNNFCANWSEVEIVSYRLWLRAKLTRVYFSLNWREILFLPFYLFPNRAQVQKCKRRILSCGQIGKQCKPVQVHSFSQNHLSVLLQRVLVGATSPIPFEHHLSMMAARSFWAFPRVQLLANLSRSNMIKNNFCATCAEVKNVFPALLDILVFSTIIQ